MKKEFCTYNQALRLKALGFDNIPCLAVYYDVPQLDDSEYEFFDFHNHFTYAHYETQYYAQKGYKNGILAPTFSQAFRWFMEKYSLIGSIDYSNRLKWYYVLREFITSDIFPNLNTSSKGEFESYEEAELACLDKLLEIVSETNHQKHE